MTPSHDDEKQPSVSLRPFVGTPAVQRIYQEIGERVRVRRKELGMNQDELAAMLGLARTSVTNIEVGRQRILAHQVFEVAEALDMDVAELLDVTPRAPKPARDVLTIDRNASWSSRTLAMTGERG